MNSVNLTAKIVTDLELKTTKNDIHFINFICSIRTVEKDDAGKNKSMLLKCVAFRKNAELIAQYCTKGSKVAISGSLSCEPYTMPNPTPNESAMYKPKMILDHVTFLDNPNYKFDTKDDTKDVYKKLDEITSKQGFNY